MRHISKTKTLRSDYIWCEIVQSYYVQTWHNVQDWNKILSAIYFPSWLLLDYYSATGSSLVSLTHSARRARDGYSRFSPRRRRSWRFGALYAFNVVYFFLLFFLLHFTILSIKRTASGGRVYSCSGRGTVVSWSTKLMMLMFSHVWDR